MPFSSLYKYISIAGIALFAVFGSSYFIREYTYAAPGDGSEGNPYTICASGCDYDSLESYRLAIENVEISVSPTSTYVEVREGYDADAEPEFMGGALTGQISCENDSVVVERDSFATPFVLSLASESSLSSCFLRNVYLDINETSGVAGNTFEYTTFERNAILFGSSGVSEIADVTIRANEFIISGVSGLGNNFAVLFFTAGKIYNEFSILENTFVVEPSVSEYTNSFIVAPSQEIIRTQIASNIFYNSNTSSDFISIFDDGGDVEIYISKNTFVTESQDVQFISLSDVELNGFSIVPSLGYNLFVNRSGAPDQNDKAVYYGPEIHPSWAFNQNGFSGYINTPGYNYSTDSSLESSSDLFLTAQFRGNETDTYQDDFNLVPYSSYLDVDKFNTDTGIDDTDRISSIVVSNTDTVDYSDVHASTTAVLGEHIRAGDTWTIIGGGDMYEPVVVVGNPFFSGSSGGSTTTIQGVNAPIIRGEEVSAFSLEEDTKTPFVISDIEFQTQATGDGTSFITYWSLDSEETTYGDIGNILFLDDCENGYDSFFFISPDTSFEISPESAPLLDGGVSVALIDVVEEGSGDILRYLLYLPRSVYPNSSAFEGSNCVDTIFGGSVDNIYLESLYTYVDGALVLDESVLTDNAVVVTTDFPSTNIVVESEVIAGIELSDSDDVWLISVTTTGGVYGLYVTGENDTITVSSSVFVDNEVGVYLNGELSSIVFSSSVLRDNDIDIYFSSPDISLGSEVIFVDTLFDPEKVEIPEGVLGNITVGFSLPAIRVVDSTSEPVDNALVYFYIPFSDTTSTFATGNDGLVEYVSLEVFACTYDSKEGAYYCNDVEESKYENLAEEEGVTCTLDAVLNQYDCVREVPLENIALPAFIMDAATTSIRNGGYNPYIVTVEATESYASSTLEFDLVEPDQEVEVVVALVGEEEEGDQEEEPVRSRKGGGASFFLINKKQQTPLNPPTVSQENTSQTNSVVVNRGKRSTVSRRIPIYIPPYINANEIHIQFNTLGEKIITRRIPKNRTVWAVLPAGAGDKTLFFSLNGKESVLWDDVQLVYTPAVPRTVLSTPSTTSQLESSTTTFTRFLTTGMSGDDVRSLQLLLQRLGFFPASITPNGVYGPATTAAVIAFQRANGIDPFGYVGPATRAVLNAL